MSVYSNRPEPIVELSAKKNWRLLVKWALLIIVLAIFGAWLWAEEVHAQTLPNAQPTLEILTPERLAEIRAETGQQPGPEPQAPIIVTQAQLAALEKAGQIRAQATGMPLVDQLLACRTIEDRGDRNKCRDYVKSKMERENRDSFARPVQSEQKVVKATFVDGQETGRTEQTETTSMTKDAAKHDERMAKILNPPDPCGGFLPSSRCYRNIGGRMQFVGQVGDYDPQFNYVFGNPGHVAPNTTHARPNANTGKRSVYGNIRRPAPNTTHARPDAR